MTNLTLSGTIEKDAFKVSGGREPTMYGKLEVTVEKGKIKGKHTIIQASDINITDLDKISLLVLKTKDEKYDGIDIKYKVNMDGDTEEAKLNSTKILWLSLENKKPLSSIVVDKKIKDIELWLEEDQPTEQAIVEILVLRRMPSPNEESPSQKTR